ncbi:MAG: hypothetical protein ACKVSF_00865 [Alphaproteobacteria bacterium]
MAQPQGRIRAHARQMSSLLFQRGDCMEYVKSGSQFRRVLADRTVETAEVIAVQIDQQGIPHLRYRVDFTRPNRQRYVEGPRVLAARSFFDLYQERVSAA